MCRVSQEIINVLLLVDGWWGHDSRLLLAAARVFLLVITVSLAAGPTEKNRNFIRSFSCCWFDWRRVAEFLVRPSLVVYFFVKCCCSLCPRTHMHLPHPAPPLLSPTKGYGPFRDKNEESGGRDSFRLLSECECVCVPPPPPPLYLSTAVLVLVAITHSSPMAESTVHWKYRIALYTRSV